MVVVVLVDVDEVVEVVEVVEDDVLVDDVEGDEVDVEVEASVVAGVVVVVFLDVVVIDVLGGAVDASVEDAPARPAVGPASSLQAVAATRATPTTSATTRSLTRPTYVTDDSRLRHCRSSTTRLRPRNSAITVVPVASTRSTVTS